MDFHTMMRRVASGAAVGIALGASVGSAQALPIIDGWTAVNLTAAADIAAAGVAVAPLGSALVSPGSSGTPVAYFAITGGMINTDTFAGTIEHEGSGLSLSNAMATVELENFVINTVTGFLSGDVTVGATTLDDVDLFAIGLSGSPAYPFSLTVTAGAAGALTTFLGVPDLTGVQIGIASTTPVTTAVPETSTYAMLLAGLGVLGFVARRRAPARMDAAAA